jgi:HD-GYP domain-containing protein (c-di-GMP phosphodiesterase class II)/CheY-like chemotaxis protein
MFTDYRDLRVLICDDSKANNLVIAAILADQGIHNTQSFTDPRTLITAFERGDACDLLILDIEMPHLDGFQVMRDLQARFPPDDIFPILIISGSQAVDVRNRALAQGATDFVNKPFDQVEVRHRVSNLLRLRQAHLRRTASLHVAEDKLGTLIDTSRLLAAEQDRLALLRRILDGGQRICNCDAATLYIRTEHDSLRFALVTNDLDTLLENEIPLYDPATGAANAHYVSTYVALHNRTVKIDDVYLETRFDLSGTRAHDQRIGYRSTSMLTVPMAPRAGEVIGVLQFINAMDPATGAVIAFPEEIISFVEALAAQSAVALDNYNLLEAQRAMLDATIRMIAGAIDAKSAYTGGHCERVPELAILLAEAANAETTGPLAGFRFATPEAWQEFRIGAWLHDCGKMTTPEYVVDKSTKLETLYNRIHEIRTRFEVLLRDARIEQLQARIGGADPMAAERAFEQRRAQLLDDFAFIARCNTGDDPLLPEEMARLRQLAGQTWWRHFDDGLGLSHEESQRLDAEPKADLPARETLLADKPRHKLPRPASAALDARYGFNMDVPELLYDFGELYNLGIPSGTLTREERFKINEHIIQTIVMLEHLPLPKHFQRIPEYAGTHHETLAGTGYPRRLGKDALSIPARIMAIADIFEALTASDRPYKKGKPLSESIRILAGFKDADHIDPDLFRLFLSSGVYRRYAERFLRPEQIDSVDINIYLA